MDPAEFAKLMRQIVEAPRDVESSHKVMDDLMCSTLKSLGYGDGVDIFCLADKWYA